MRNAIIGGSRIYYPDEVSFAFNPEYVIIKSNVEAEITLSANGKTFTDKREAIGGEMKMDISYYLQMLFDIQRYRTINTTSLSVNVALSFSGNTFYFSTLCVWGSIAPGEVFNPSRKEIWFRKKLSSQTFYFFNPIGNTTIYGSYDGGPVKLAQNISGAGGILGIMPLLLFPDAQREITLYIGNIDNIDTFDKTFDDTFHPAEKMAVTALKIEIDNCEDGVVIRWTDKSGLTHFYLFQESSLSTQTEDDGESIRIDFDGVSLIPKEDERYYNGVSRQMKNEQRTLNLNAPLVDKETFELLSSVLASPLVDAYFGEEGNMIWCPVNVVTGTKTMSNAHLQDFELSVLLPETQIQKL